MITCKNCKFWNHDKNICEDPEEWVREDTGELCCRYRSGAIFDDKELQNESL
jgi:hypothetical protein